MNEKNLEFNQSSVIEYVHVRAFDHKNTATNSFICEKKEILNQPIQVDDDRSLYIVDHLFAHAKGFFTFTTYEKTNCKSINEITKHLSCFFLPFFIFNMKVKRNIRTQTDRPPAYGMCTLAGKVITIWVDNFFFAARI